MKALLTLLVGSVFFLVSCSTGYQTSTPYDDVYYSVDVKKTNDQKQKGENSTYTTQTISTTEAYQQSDPNNEEAVTEYIDDRDYSDYQPAEQVVKEEVEYIDDFDYDDYYDYSYSARIRRFHTPNNGFSYYDPYYTNSYWYDYNPYSWGSSIYMGYNFWNPYRSWGPSFSFGYNWGWGSMYYGWPYSYGYGYGGYWNGYSNGYWNGYYDGYYSNYYNSYDRNSNYYNRGHRPSRGGATNGYHTGNDRGSRSFAEKYEAKHTPSRVARSFNSKNTTARTARSLQGTSKENVGTGRSARSTTPAIGKNISPQNANMRSLGKEKSTSNMSRSLAPREQKAQDRYSKKDQYQYSKPEKSATETRKIYRKPATYRSPQSQQSRSSQEYKVPKAVNPNIKNRSNNSRSNYTRPSNTQPKRTGQSSKKNYTTPTKSNKSYSTPKRSNSSKSYSSPSRSTSSPSRSSGSSKSYSSPSRSSSSPSRSSGSSSSSKSSSRGRR
jgi:hypothetical protein